MPAARLVQGRGDEVDLLDAIAKAPCYGVRPKAMTVQSSSPSAAHLWGSGAGSEVMSRIAVR